MDGIVILLRPGVGVVLLAIVFGLLVWGLDLETKKRALLEYLAAQYADDLTPRDLKRLADSWYNRHIGLPRRR